MEVGLEMVATVYSNPLDVPGHLRIGSSCNDELWQSLAGINVSPCSRESDGGTAGSASTSSRSWWWRILSGLECWGQLDVSESVSVSYSMDMVRFLDVGTCKVWRWFPGSGWVPSTLSRNASTFGEHSQRSWNLRGGYCHCLGLRVMAWY